MPRRSACLALSASLALLSAAAAQTGAPPVPAQPAPTPPPAPPRLAGKENAALLYYRAWDMLSREDSALIGDTFENSAKYHLAAAQVKVLEDNQRYIEQVIRAANTPDCDWGIQYDQGCQALLPHLGKLRQSCRILGADSRRLFDAGKPDEAAERVAAIARMADQTRSDGLLISSLVGAAIATYGSSATDVAFELHAMTPGIARTILNAFREIHQDDAFGAGSSIRVEEWMTVDWPRTRYTGKTAGKDMAADFEYGTSEEDCQAIAGLDADGLATELEKSRPYYEEAMRLWNEPDATPSLDALSQRAAKGEFGTTAKLTAAAFSKGRSGVDKAVGRVNATIKNLETFIATGQTPADVAAAAGAAGETK